MIRTVARRLPPIVRRDATIARLARRIDAQAVKIGSLTVRVASFDRANTKLRGDLAATRDRLARRLRPSFQAKFAADLRVRSTARDIHGAHYPILSVDSKPDGYRFAESHGVPTPTRLAQYRCPADIDWSTLPDAFVIKPVRGTSARGVLVLERHADGYIDRLADEPRPLSPDEIVADLEANAGGDRSGRGFSSQLVIEELVRSPCGLQLDLKLYCFYGTVGLITVIARDTRRQLRFRHLWPDGTDAGDIRLDRQCDPSLPGPVHLEDLVVAGEMLSAALPEPFVRLDFYERGEGIVFGEVSPRPGGKQLFRPDVDEHLGTLWEAAEAKLRAEAVQAGVHDPRFSSG